MSQTKQHRKRYTKHYQQKVISKSAFDDSPTLIINEYRTPKPYANAVTDVLAAFHSGIPFNRAVDQVSSLDSHHLNRNKLAEHTLKTIANDY